MRVNAARAALGAALLIAAAVLFVVLQDGGEDNGTAGGGYGGAAATEDRTQPGAGGEAETAPRPTRPPLPTIAVRGGEPVGGVERLEFSAGERVRFVVESDLAEEVHIHGYDITEDVPAGGSARFDFPASLEGVYEVEMHGSGAEIAELRVSP
ncbi:MAG: hypothetical protein WD404_09370 [Solirubrobacterales bacterium]